MPFIRESREVGDLVGPSTGVQRLIVLIQPVAPDEIVYLHRHDGGDQILRLLRGELLVEVDGETRTCGAGEIAIVPAGASHGFAATGEPALLEVIGEQGCGTKFAVRRDDGTVDWVEVHRPELPWDHPGEPTDIAALNERAVVPGATTAPSAPSRDSVSRPAPPRSP
jgi:quercetin dioxygenase-like cupin family protein